MGIDGDSNRGGLEEPVAAAQDADEAEIEDLEVAEDADGVRGGMSAPFQ
ncbi:hypothetical protein [Pseudonocardia sp. 73-21]|nr:hypothetical protein [Pseudonocardia sp. 73-21]